MQLWLAKVDEREYAESEYAEEMRLRGLKVKYGYAD